MAQKPELPERKESPLEKGYSPAPPPPKKEDEQTPMSKRVLAGLGALFMIILTIAFAYSIATGNVFKW